MKDRPDSPVSGQRSARARQNRARPRSLYTPLFNSRPLLLLSPLLQRFLLRSLLLYPLTPLCPLPLPFLLLPPLCLLLLLLLLPLMLLLRPLLQPLQLAVARLSISLLLFLLSLLQLLKRPPPLLLPPRLRHQSHRRSLSSRGLPHLLPLFPPLRHPFLVHMTSHSSSSNYTSNNSNNSSLFSLLLFPPLLRPLTPPHKHLHLLYLLPPPPLFTLLLRSLRFPNWQNGPLSPMFPICLAT